MVINMVEYKCPYEFPANVVRVNSSNGEMSACSGTKHRARFEQYCNSCKHHDEMVWLRDRLRDNSCSHQPKTRSCD